MVGTRKLLSPALSPGAHFSKVPIINGPGKLSPFLIKDRGFNSFASNIIKLSANKTKWSSLLARTRALILIFRCEYLISGPKTGYRGFRETGRWLGV